MRPRWERLSQPWLAALLAGALAFGLRLAPALARFQETPDAVEAWAAGRALREGRGLRLAIRAQLEPGGEVAPVDRLAVRQRAPLLPLLVAIGAGPRPSAGLQLIPALAASLAAALAALVMAELARAEGRRAGPVAWVGGLVVATHPLLFGVSTRLLTEPLELALALLGAWGAARRGGLGPRALGGMAWGLLALARPEGLLWGGAAALSAGLLLPMRRLERRAWLAGWLAVAAPWVAVSLARFGTPLPTQGGLLRARDLHDVMWGWQPEAPVVAPLWALKQALAHAFELLKAALEPRHAALWPLALAWGCRRCGRLRAWLLGLAALSLIGKAAVWASLDAHRFAATGSVLVALLGVDAWGRWAPRAGWGRRLWWGLALASVCALGGRCLRRQAPRPLGGAWVSEDRAAVGARLRGGAGVVAATSPWVWHIESGRPAALLPVALEAEALSAYLERVGARVVVLSPGAPHPGIPEPERYGAWLRAWGWRAEELGGTWVYVRP